ncbi:MAG: hypothetical protein Q8N18_17735 [Opitutaceae bacterium]|nr:hypothetical protein [Opitutaceae bacterium]
MRTRLILALATLVLAAPGLAAPAPKAAKGAARAVSVQAILITASNQQGGVDRKLAAYAENLKRNLPFDTFRFAAEDRTTLPEGGRATITFAGDHRLELEDSPGGGIRLKVFWLTGPDVVISTTLTLQAGVPGVLVRRGAGSGEVPVVLLIAR